MGLFRWDDAVQEGEQFIDSVEFSEAIDYVIDECIQGERTAEKASEYRELLADSYNADSPLALHVGNAEVKGELVPFRVMARSPLEARFVAKRHFGEVPVSVRKADDGRKRRDRTRGQSEYRPDVAGDG